MNSTVEKRTKALNWVVSGFLILLLIAATLSVGANRPVFWALNAAVVLAVSAIVLACAGFGVTQLRYPFTRWGFIGWIALAYVCGVGIYFAVALALGEKGAVSQGNMLLGLLRILTYAGVYFLTLQVATSVRRARKLAWAIFAAVVLLALYGLIAHRAPEFLLYDKPAGMSQLTGPFINRNSYATFLAMGCAIGTSLVLRNDRSGGMGRKKSRFDVELIAGRAFVFVAVLLLFASILASGSRMGALVGVLAIMVPVVLRVLHSRQADVGGQAVLGIAIAVVVLLAFVLVGALYGGLLVERLGSTGMSADVRLDLYRNIWKIILERPLFGYGLDSFEFAFRQGHELPVSPDLRWKNAHNTYLELWLELGLILGSLPPLLCAVALLRLMKRAATNQYTGYLAQAVVAVIIVGAVHSLADFSLEIEANVFLFLMLAALGLAPNDVKIESDDA